VIVWLNGAFGAGKTTTSLLLRSRLERVRIFDPEAVGALLRDHLADRPVADFQALGPWVPVVVATAVELVRERPSGGAWTT